MYLYYIGLFAAGISLAVTHYFKKEKLYVQMLMVEGIVYIGVVALTVIAAFTGSHKDIADHALAAAVVMSALFESVNRIEEYIQRRKEIHIEIEKEKKQTETKPWYIFLLIISSIYILLNFENIGSLKELDMSAIIFIAWLLLLSLPLFSSIEIGSIKLSRKIESIEAETKGSIRDLKMQIMELKVTNSNSVIVQNGGYISPNGELKNMIKVIKECEHEAPLDENKSVKISEDVLFLLKSRFELEHLLVQLSDNYWFSERGSISKMVHFLKNHEALTDMQCKIILNVINICNRAAHGEGIADEHISFVKETMPGIIAILKKEIESDVHYFVCDKCNYVGPSKYENSCPRCNRVTCD